MVIVLGALATLIATVLVVALLVEPPEDHRQIVVRPNRELRDLTQWALATMLDEARRHAADRRADSKASQAERRAS
ncbi:MAG TPA: hypothetical protein VF257_01440 [Solirubrobacteraceae bacterium]